MLETFKCGIQACLGLWWKVNSGHCGAGVL